MYIQLVGHGVKVEVHSTPESAAGLQYVLGLLSLSFHYLGGKCLPV